MASLPSGKFWACPICRNANEGTFLWCERCRYRPNQLDNIVTRRLKYIPAAVLTRRALKKANRDKTQDKHLKDAYSAKPAITKITPPANRYAESTFHRNQTPSEPSRLPNRTPTKLPPSNKALSNAETWTPKAFQDNESNKTIKPKHNKPAPAHELTPELFELYCAEWCTYLGHKNVKVTRSTKDGGIDITGDTFIAQVKLQELPVGVKPIRELAGVLTTQKKTMAYFFTLNGYSNAALQEGEELGIALYEIKPFTSQITPKTAIAALILEDAELTN